MEGLSALHRRVAGIDVHRMLHVVTALIEEDDTPIIKHQKEFGGFKRDMKSMTAWLLAHRVSMVVMESTGIYWKSAHAHLERAGIATMIVNAHFIKYVPGRKTDMGDSEWLAVLARFGLVRGSFIPPKDLRELRLISRYRRKLSQTLSSETNRMHKTLDDGGVKLGAVVSDIKGVSARAMVTGLIQGKPMSEMLNMARGSLKNKREELAASLDGDLSARHLFILEAMHDHVIYLERELARIDAYLIEAMKPYQWAWELLQTIPGIDAIASTMILIEIGDDMSRFGDADRLASWAALCPGNNESAGKRKTGKTRKGNAIIRYILCECANAARVTKSSLAAKYRNLKIRKSHKKSIVAIAHKLIRIIYFMLLRHEPYRDSGVDYEVMSAQKNAPRWIKALKKSAICPQQNPP